MNTHTTNIKSIPVGKLSLVLILIGAILIIGQIWYLRSNQSIPSQSIVSTNQFQPKPVRIKINQLGVDAPIVNLGLNRDGTLEVPKGSADVGWYTESPAPGALGPAILVGHLDSIQGPAVFSRLRELKAGDTIEVLGEDGSIAVFKVDNLENYSQSNFPTEKVYGPINYAGIRLITCSGKYNHFLGRYSDNLVVYGTLSEISET